jgi:uncharacterized membrane protein YeaQ/YmgE (transglycosylase-associated protein family)
MALASNTATTKRRRHEKILNVGMTFRWAPQRRNDTASNNTNKQTKQTETNPRPLYLPIDNYRSGHCCDGYLAICDLVYSKGNEYFQVAICVAVAVGVMAYNVDRQNGLNYTLLTGIAGGWIKQILFRSSWEAHLEPQRRHHFICVSILPL